MHVDVCAGNFSKDSSPKNALSDTTEVAEDVNKPKTKLQNGSIQLV